MSFVPGLLFLFFKLHIFPGELYTTWRNKHPSLVNRFFSFNRAIHVNVGLNNSLLSSKALSEPDARRRNRRHNDVIKTKPSVRVPALLCTGSCERRGTDIKSRHLVSVLKRFIKRPISTWTMYNFFFVNNDWAYWTFLVVIRDSKECT